MDVGGWLRNLGLGQARGADTRHAQSRSVEREQQHGAEHARGTDAPIQSPSIMPRIRFARACVANGLVMISMPRARNALLAAFSA